MFLAVVPAKLPENAELQRLLGKLKRTMRERDQAVRWVAADLWHVTLQFLGEIPQARSELIAWLDEWRPSHSDLRIRLRGLGAFPDPAAARVLWIGVQASQEFLDLQAELGAGLAAAGFTPQVRETYTPHLTLARFRNSISALDLCSLGGRRHFGDYAISDLVLFESVLQGNIIKYSAVHRKRLEGGSGDGNEDFY